MRVRFEKLSIVSTVCGYFLPRHFDQHSPLHVFPFSPLVDYCRVRVIILQWIMSKVSALYLESFRQTFLCIEHPKCSLSLVGIKKHSRAVTKGLNNLQEKADYIEKQSLIKKTVSIFPGFYRVYGAQGKGGEEVFILVHFSSF